MTDKMTDGQIHRLTLLIDCCCKTITHSTNAMSYGELTASDAEQLEKAIGGVLACGGLLAMANDISWTKIIKHSDQLTEYAKLHKHVKGS